MDKRNDWRDAVFKRQDRGRRLDVAMQRKPGVFTILLAGGAVCALAGQLHATGLFTPQAKSTVHEASAASSNEKDRTRARPAPGSLTGAVEAHGFWFGASEEPAAKREPFRVETPAWTKKQLQAIATEPGNQKDWAVVEGSVVNVRSGPSANASRIGSFERGTRLRVIERQEKWTRIEDPETQQTGWMYRTLLKVSDPGKAG